MGKIFLTADACLAPVIAKIPVIDLPIYTQ